MPVDRSHPTPTRARSGPDSSPYGSRIETPVRRPGLCRAARRPRHSYGHFLADERLPAGPSRRPKQDVFDRQLQILVGRDADGVAHAACLQRLVDRRPREGRTGLSLESMSSTTRSDRSNVSACPIRSRFTAISPTRFSSRVSSSVSNQCSVEVSAALRSHRFGEASGTPALERLHSSGMSQPL